MPETRPSRTRAARPDADEGVPPPEPLGLSPTFGFGDRLGLATPGHLAALREHGGSIRGIFAQQSIREMTRTDRTPEQVMAAAREGLGEGGYDEPWGADADHLKTPEDVEATVAAGFTFFTIDPSEYVDGQVDGYDAATLQEKFEGMAGELPWLSEYEQRTIEVDDGPRIHFDRVTLQRAAVKYGRAINHVIDLAGHIHRGCAERGQDYELELSVDETPQPTTAAEHYLIADRCREHGLKLVSLAPRYVGEFEKGIDFKGEMSAFESSLADHAAIARHLGPYKLSLHSGSDKLSIYAAFARVTDGRFHVKTAGTSYLEALRVLARHEPRLLRQIIKFSRGRFETDRASYHISADLARVPPPDAVEDDADLERVYLDENDGRQVLHVTFGSVLSDADYRRRIQEVLEARPEAHREVLETHLGRHLDRLREGMDQTQGG